jgi:hypothetical protein
VPYEPGVRGLYSIPYENHISHRIKVFSSVSAWLTEKHFSKLRYRNILQITFIEIWSVGIDMNAEHHSTGDSRDGLARDRQRLAVMMIHAGVFGVLMAVSYTTVAVMVAIGSLMMTAVVESLMFLSDSGAALNR